MEEDILQYLKQRHQYELWHNRTTLDDHLFIWQVFLNGQEFPGWEPYRIQTIRSAQLAAPAAQAARALPGPGVLHSLWRHAQGGSEALLSVDLFQCESRAAAHEFIVRLLGEFQSTLIERQEPAAIGDVAFSALGGYVVVFARANLVLLMRNAGRDLVPIHETARQYDRTLIAKTETPATETGAQIRGFRVWPADRRSRGKVPIRIAAPRQQQLMYKFFSRSGEVELEGQRPVYQPTSAGPHELEVYAVSPDSSVRRVVEITLE